MKSELYQPLMSSSNQDSRDRNTILAPGFSLSPNYFYPFMYLDQTIDTADLFNGLFRGRLIVKVCVSIGLLRLWLVITSRQGLEIIYFTNRNARKQGHKFKSIKPAMIAYICTLVSIISHRQSG
jgi:hypothetical protein